MRRSTLPFIVSSPSEMQHIAKGWQQENRSIGFAPTMGCLHEGHLTLIRAARRRADKVVASIFVNPLQFGKNEDLSAYPRPFERDVELCQQEGVDVIFAPDPKTLYPRQFATSLQGGELTKKYCGRTRPIHFNGVLTIVKILFELVRPSFAFFGEKDFQQLFLIKQMCRDLWIPVDIVSMPIIRELSGLAMSSRNTYLTTEQKERATCLYHAIRQVQEVVSTGQIRSTKLIDIAQRLIAQTQGMQIDYVHLVDHQTLEPLGDHLSKPARLLLAAFVGDAPRVRLIDNGLIAPHAPKMAT